MHNKRTFSKTSVMTTPTTAIAVLPPEHLWPRIQSIRQRHDRVFSRWPPHVNLIYPFVEPTERLVTKLSAAIARISLFRLTLDRPTLFRNYVCHHVLHAQDGESGNSSMFPQKVTKIWVL